MNGKIAGYSSGVMSAVVSCGYFFVPRRLDARTMRRTIMIYARVSRTAFAETISCNVCRAASILAISIGKGLDDSCFHYIIDDTLQTRAEKVMTVSFNDASETSSELLMILGIHSLSCRLRRKEPEFTRVRKTCGKGAR